jgi:hypothetical protein
MGWSTIPVDALSGIPRLLSAREGVGDCASQSLIATDSAARSSPADIKGKAFGRCRAIGRLFSFNQHSQLLPPGQDHRGVVFRANCTGSDCVSIIHFYQCRGGSPARPTRSAAVKGTQIAILPWVATVCLGGARSLRSGTVFPGEKRDATALRLSAVWGRPAHLHRRAACADRGFAPRRTMAPRYRLKLVPRQDIVLLHRVTQRPRDGIRMQLERRS